jgi:hypothetical protein
MPRTGSGQPDGNVLFTFTPSVGSPVTQLVALQPVGGLSQATPDLTQLPAGKYTKITAAYQGSTTFAASLTPATELTIYNGIASLTVVGQAVKLKFVQVMVGSTAMTPASPLKITQNSPLTVTLQALDANNNAVSVFNPSSMSVSATNNTSSGVAITATSNSAFVNANTGLGTFNSIKLSSYPIGTGTVTLTFNLGTLSTQLLLTISAGRLVG